MFRFNRIKSFVNESSRRHIKHHELEDEFHKRLHELYREVYSESKDFKWYRNHIKYSRIFIIVFNLVAWFLIFYFWGAKALSIGFALLMSISGISQFIFLITLEKRVFKPITKLKAGVDEISKGNYDINVQCEVRNEINSLIVSFNKMAEKLKESETLKLQYEENRKMLIANISHDLKTPITSIQGYIETMSERNDLPKETIDKYHQIIYNNAAYINKLIDDLFLFSKLDMEKLDLNLEHINIRAFMEDLMEEFKLELEDRHVALQYENKITEESFVNIDIKRVYQIFKNIIGNAVKYGIEDKIKIDVSLYEHENEIFIDIKDNGPGISEDKLPYIFDRFYRVDYARTKDLMSTGLGLAISKELVEAHGGKITASSSKDLGTCFTITIPKKN